MSHLLSCSAHLKSAADVKARCLAVDASEAEADPHRRCMRKTGGLQLRLASFIPAELSGVARLSSYQLRQAIERRRLCVLRWPSAQKGLATEARSPRQRHRSLCLPLTNYLKVTRARLSSWWSNAADWTSRWLPLSFYCLLWLTSYELGHIPKAV